MTEYNHVHSHGEGEPHTHEETENTAVHQHVLEDGTVIEHSHSHGHTHTHQHTKAVINRLSRAIGHLESIKRMVESGRDCSEVLIQLSAVKSALNNTGKVILQDHIEHCIVDAVKSGDTHELEELNKAIDQFMK
jgi:DNA-binding FrmR family transcriptional regulator